jgi:hypothetical protein
LTIEFSNAMRDFLINRPIMAFGDVVAELSRPRLHGVGARLLDDGSFDGTFVYSFLGWKLRILAHRFDEDAAVLTASIRSSRQLAITTILGAHWNDVLGPATVGPGRMYRSTREFLLALYETLRSRRDVQRSLARSERWPIVV